jgi:hypothetical protein
MNDDIQKVLDILELVFDTDVSNVKHVALSQVDKDKFQLTLVRSDDLEELAEYGLLAKVIH